MSHVPVIDNGLCLLWQQEVQDCCSWLYLQAVLEAQTVRQDKKIYFERAGGMADFGSGIKTRKPF